MTTRDEPKGKPLFLLDLMRLREGLDIDARGSVRILLDPLPSGKLGIALECCACEELLEWDGAQTWWCCPSCEREFTEAEVEKLLVACAEVFIAATQEPQAPEVPSGPSEGEEEGPWRGRLRNWILGH